MFTKVIILQFFFNFILVYLLNDKTFYGFKLIIKTKSLDSRLIIKAFSSVGMTGFEPATTRPPDVYSNRAELHPE